MIEIQSKFQGESMSNRVAFVTGASRGIGRAIALTLCRAGFEIVVASPGAGEQREGRRQRSAPAAGRPCTARIWTHFARVDQGGLRGGAARSSAAIDVLVNNAGITRDGLAVRMKPEDWDLVLQINLNGAFLTHPAGAARHDARALGPHHQHRLGGGPDRATPARPTTSRRRRA